MQENKKGIVINSSKIYLIEGQVALTLVNVLLDELPARHIETINKVKSLLTTLKEYEIVSNSEKVGSTEDKVE
jgi:hypothetical protein